jgi:DNA-directed RNA polymerase specialized sigma24 family protein
MVKDPFERIDLARCEALAGKAADGDQAAWSEMVERLWPALGKLVQSSRSMGGARSEDDVRDVQTKLLTKLGGRGGRGLKLYATWRGRHPDKTFEDWLRIVVKNAIRDSARQALGASGAKGEPSVKRLLNEFASSPALESIGVRPPITAAQTARQLLEFSRKFLPKEQYRALTRWLEGDSFEEIGESCEVTPEAARLLVRAAVAVLRRHFASA